MATNMKPMLKTMVSKKNANELTNEDKQMLETYGQKVDFTDKISIEPLTGFVRNLTK